MIWGYLNQGLPNNIERFFYYRSYIFHRTHSRLPQWFEASSIKAYPTLIIDHTYFNAHTPEVGNYIQIAYYHVLKNYSNWGSYFLYYLDSCNDIEILLFRKEKALVCKSLQSWFWIRVHTFEIENWRLKNGLIQSCSKHCTLSIW